VERGISLTSKRHPTAAAYFRNVAREGAWADAPHLPRGAPLLASWCPCARPLPFASTPLADGHSPGHRRARIPRLKRHTPGEMQGPSSRSRSCHHGVSRRTSRNRLRASSRSLCGVFWVFLMKAWRIIIVWPAAVQHNARPMPSLPLAQTSNNPSPSGRVNGIPRWGTKHLHPFRNPCIHGANANRPHCNVLPDGLTVILNLP
jgi:hypothetical protein